jgi:hypothetical protein
MENKLLLEEIKRFRLLSGYKPGNTHYENELIINERVTPLKDALKSGEELSRALRDIKGTSELRSIESTLLRDIGGELKVGGKELKTLEEIISALREGKLAEREAGSVIYSLLHNSKEGSALNKASMEYLASQKSTLEYAERFKSVEELKNSIIKNPKNKLSEKQAEELAKKVFELKDAKTAEQSKTAKETGQVKQEKELEKAKDREIERGKEEKRRGEIENKRERESERYKTEQQKIELENERILRQTESEAKEAMAKAERANAEVREIKSKQEMIEAETRLMKEKEALAEIRNQKPNVVLHWLKTNRFINFAKKIILNKWVWILGGGALAAYWAWNKFFKDNGIKVECEEGKVIDPKTGDCVDKSKLEDEQNQDGQNQDGQNQDGKIPGTGSQRPGSSGSEDGVNDGISYRNCSGTYSLGCKDLPYTDAVKKIQKCLGIKDTGYFGKNTERELESATSKKTIDRSGIRLLCGDF